MLEEEMQDGIEIPDYYETSQTFDPPLNTTTLAFTTISDTDLDPELVDLKLVVIIAIAVLSLLTVIFILAIYFCCKRCLCAKEVAILMNKSSEQPQSDITPFNSAANTIIINTKQPSQIGSPASNRLMQPISTNSLDTTARSVITSTDTKRIPIRKSLILFETKAKPQGRKRTGKSVTNLNATKGMHSSISSSTVPSQQAIDKASSIPDTFNPTTTRSKKEILLFKAASFSE